MIQDDLIMSHWSPVTLLLSCQPGFQSHEFIIFQQLIVFVLRLSQTQISKMFLFTQYINYKNYESTDTD